MSKKDPILELIAAVAEADVQVDGPTLDHLNAVYESAQDVVALFQRLDPTQLYAMLDGIATIREINLSKRADAEAVDA